MFVQENDCQHLNLLAVVIFFGRKKSQFSTDPKSLWAQNRFGRQIPETNKTKGLLTIMTTFLGVLRLGGGPDPKTGTGWKYWAATDTICKCILGSNHFEPRISTMFMIFILLRDQSVHRKFDISGDLRFKTNEQMTLPGGKTNGSDSFLLS